MSTDKQRAAAMAGPPSDLALSVRDVSKSFAGVPALRDVSFDLLPGSVHCLVGGNGSGKSTMIKILAGVHQGDAGEIDRQGVRKSARDMTPSVARELGLHFVHQQQSTFPDLTVAENLAIGHGFERRGVGINWSALNRRADSVLERFGVSVRPSTLMRDLGPARQTMVAIARALQGQEHEADGVLVLDEPTAALPAHEVDILLSALRSYAEAGQTILFVTHRLSEVLDVAHRVTAFRDGRVAGTAERADLDHGKLIHMIVGRPVEDVMPVAARARVAGAPVLTTRGLAGGPIRGVDLTVNRGEVVGLAGLLGSGRTHLLRMLFGASPIDSGSVQIDGHECSIRDPRDAMAVGIALVPEDRREEAAFSDMSVGENLGISVPGRFFQRGRIRHRAERRESDGLARQFFVKASSLNAPLSSLSGGNQQKVILARWMRRSPKLLLLDEPTQGVDIGSRSDIWNLVHGAVEQGTGVLVVSSDMEELPLVCNRVLVIRNGVIDEELSGEELTENRLEQAILGQVTV